MNLKISLAHVIRVLVRLSILFGLTTYFGPDFVDAICITFVLAWAMGYIEHTFDKYEEVK